MSAAGGGAAGRASEVRLLNGSPRVRRRLVVQLRQVEEVSHGWSSVWTSPWLLQVCHVSDDGGHALPTERGADHDGRPAGARRQHGRHFGQADHAGTGMLVQQCTQLVDIAGTEGELFAEGKSFDADAPPRRRHPTGLMRVVVLALRRAAAGVAVFVILLRHVNVESVLSKDVRVFPQRDLHGGRAVERQRIEQRLRVDHGRTLQIFEAILLIRRVLIDDETARAHKKKEEKKDKLPNMAALQRPE